MGNFTYRVFDLAIGSNLAIPGLASASHPTSSIDVQASLGLSPQRNGDIPRGAEEIAYESPSRNDAGEPGLRMWRLLGGAFLRIEYRDGVRFWVDANGTQIWSDWPDDLSVADMATYLVGPVLGFLLRLRGVTCIHASAVSYDSRAIIFVGGSGSGKSTTAAALASHGCSVLSDDVTALVDRCGTLYVLPAYPHLCLWPESVKLLSCPEETMPRFIPSWDKRRLSLDNRPYQFEQRAQPLAGVYLLGERRRESCIEIADPQKAFLKIVSNSYATNTLAKKERAREFEFLGRLIDKIPIWHLHPQQSLRDVPQFCNSVIKNIAIPLQQTL